jgi:hypothetical protein
VAPKYSKKTAEKVARTMHELKRGTLKSGSGGKVTSRKQAIAIGLSQARARDYKVPAAHAVMNLDDRVRAYLGNMKPDAEVDARGLARRIGDADPLGTAYALERAVRAGLATTSEGKWFGPARHTAHATQKKYPYIAYWIRSRGLGGKDSVPVYVLGTCRRADEGLVGYDLRIRPLRLGKGTYTSVVSPDDVEDKP